MKAIRVVGYGGPEVLELVDVSEPAPGPGELLLEVTACGLNWSDLLQRAGLYPGGPRPPLIAGQEAEGIVAGHGPGVSSPPLGTRVCAIAATGLAAGQAVVAASTCFPLPDAVPPSNGAAVAVSLLTAGGALILSGHAIPGETVLVHAGGGALGTMAVQVARSLGLRVAATVSSPEKMDRVAALGAEVVCGYDVFEAEVRKLSNDRGLDLAVDSIGGAISERTFGLLGSFGRQILVGLSSGERARIDTLKLLHRSRGVMGFHLRSLLQRPELASALATRLWAWLADGSVRPQVADVLPLREIRRAHDLLASRQTFGKIVLTVQG
ncbi:MAG TPA: NADPH:quinone oxidoreductase family protein [Polyangia bacterium]|nr:NADPH:quinone oxidoreductase family protein [Polyangia bacterium]